MNHPHTALVDMFRALTLTASASHVHVDRAAASVGQSLARWSILDMFADEPRTVPAAARRLRQTRQSTQRIVDLLVEEGLLDRLANPDHRRSPLYEVTADGEVALERLAASVVPWHSFVQAQLTDDEVADLTALLQRLREIADDYTPGADR